MTKLTWSNIAGRQFETGLDRGVLYPSNPAPGELLHTNLATSPQPTNTNFVGVGAGYRFGGGTNLSAQALPTANDGPEVNNQRIGYVRILSHASDPSSFIGSWRFTDAKALTTPVVEPGFPIMPGRIYRVSYLTRVKSSTITTKMVRTSIRAYNSANEPLAGNVSATSPELMDGVWSKISVLMTAPSGGVKFGISSDLTGSVGSRSSGDSFDVTGLIIVDVTSDDTVNPDYFDGSFPSDGKHQYSWEGASNASTSTQSSNPVGAVPWSGLTAVDEAGGESAVSYYIDGRPYLHFPRPKEFAATIKAYTYPDEFAAMMGLVEVADGMYLDSQVGDSFHLSYRTLVGNATDGLDHGYKIHLVYNVTVVPSSVSYQSSFNTINAHEFSWGIQAVPVPVEGYRSTAHVIIDTRHMEENLTRRIEAMLYGTGNTAPYMPDPNVILDMLSFGDTIIITDHGDGTWSAEGSYANVYLIGDGVFEIKNVDAIDNGDGTYTIASTNV